MGMQKSKPGRLWLSVALAAFGLAAPAAAQGPLEIDRWPEEGLQRFTAPGLVVSVVETDDQGEAVVVNGETVMASGMISLEEAWAFPEGFALIGSDGMGDRRCHAERFVLWLSEGDHRIDRPIATCAAIGISRRDAGLAIRSEQVPGEQTLEWHWSPEAGLAEPTASAFSPDLHLHWEDLSSLENVHPLQMLSYADVWNPLVEGLAEEELWTLAEIFQGIGSGAATRDMYIGEVCDPFSCWERFGWLWIDQDSRGVYLLWQEETGVTAFHPPAREAWPLWVLVEAEQILAREGQPEEWQEGAE